ERARLHQPAAPGRLIRGRDRALPRSTRHHPTDHPGPRWRMRRPGPCGPAGSRWPWTAEAPWPATQGFPARSTRLPDAPPTLRHGSGTPHASAVASIRHVRYRVMNQALWVAKTGLDAQQTRMSVVANNLANTNTTGFKRDRANFEDLL